MGKAKHGTYRITFWNGEKYIVGNNYKWWWVHAIETANMLKRTKWADSTIGDHQMFKSVEYSRVPFVDDGGLKYCASSDYQSLIDEVAAKSGKKLKHYRDYEFEVQPAELTKLDKEYARW